MALLKVTIPLNKSPEPEGEGLQTISQPEESFVLNRATINLKPSISETVKITNLAAYFQIIVCNIGGAFKKSVTTTTTIKAFKTEAERNNYILDEGGRITSVEETRPPGTGAPGFKKLTEVGLVGGPTAVKATETVTVTAEESIFPFPLPGQMMIVRNGQIVFIDYLNLSPEYYGEANGEELGTAVISSFTDLVNPIEIRSGDTAQFILQFKNTSPYKLGVYSGFTKAKGGAFTEIRPAPFLTLSYDTPLEAGTLTGERTA